MKRLLASLITLILLLACTSLATAEESKGVFVPTYEVFIEKFASKVKTISPIMHEAIVEDCYIDGKWQAPSNYDNRIWDFYSAPIITIYTGNGFLESIRIKLAKSDLKKEEGFFKDLMLAAATSIITDADEEFVSNFFDNIYYDYTINSPAGYISMYWNCGVYLFDFTKSSSDLEFEISLSVYEVEQ